MSYIKAMHEEMKKQFKFSITFSEQKAAETFIWVNVCQCFRLQCFLCSEINKKIYKKV